MHTGMQHCKGGKVKIRILLLLTFSCPLAIATTQMGKQ